MCHWLTSHSVELFKMYWTYWNTVRENRNEICDKTIKFPKTNIAGMPWQRPLSLNLDIFQVFKQNRSTLTQKLILLTKPVFHCPFHIFLINDWAISVTVGSELKLLLVRLCQASIIDQKVSAKSGATWMALHQWFLLKYGLEGGVPTWAGSMWVCAFWASQK